MKRFYKNKENIKLLYGKKIDDRKRILSVLLRRQSGGKKEKRRKGLKIVDIERRIYKRTVYKRRIYKICFG